jgi:hypothetical protein
MLYLISKLTYENPEIIEKINNIVKESSITKIILKYASDTSKYKINNEINELKNNKFDDTKMKLFYWSLSSNQLVIEHRYQIEGCERYYLFVKNITKTHIKDGIYKVICYSPGGLSRYIESPHKITRLYNPIYDK